MNIHESAEDYLEMILMLREEKGYARSVDIAAKLGVTRPSVSFAMKNLRENGYITMNQENYISLTETGDAIARRIYDRHKVLTRFLVQIGVNEQTARKDACKIEHDISEETFAVLRSQLREVYREENPLYCGTLFSSACPDSYRTRSEQEPHDRNSDSVTDVQTFAKAVRAHWGIEASLHHVLDVSFHEDASRIHKDHSADNLAVIRHFALNALSFLDVGKKNVSARRKRKMCGRNPQLLLLALDKILSPKSAP